MGARTPTHPLPHHHHKATRCRQPPPPPRGRDAWVSSAAIWDGAGPVVHPHPPDPGRRGKGGLPVAMEGSAGHRRSRLPSSPPPPAPCTQAGPPGCVWGAVSPRGPHQLGAASSSSSWVRRGGMLGGINETDLALLLARSSYLPALPSLPRSAWEGLTPLTLSLPPQGSHPRALEGFTLVRFPKESNEAAGMSCPSYESHLVRGPVSWPVAEDQPCRVPPGRAGA